MTATDHTDPEEDVPGRVPAPRHINESSPSGSVKLFSSPAVKPTHGVEVPMSATVPVNHHG